MVLSARKSSKVTQSYLKQAPISTANDYSHVGRQCPGIDIPMCCGVFRRYWARHCVLSPSTGEAIPLIRFEQSYPGKQ
jgi:hypothetical protein